MADVHCPKCGEPTDTYEFHDAASELGVDYSEAFRRFRTEGCEALPGWRCNPETNRIAADAAQAVYAMTGDDMDGAAADLEGIVRLILTTPTPEPTPDVYQLNLTAADADRMARALTSCALWMTSDPHRYALRQIHVTVDMHQTEPQWTFTATDSYGLARVRCDRPEMNHTNLKVPFTFGIPHDAVKPWAKQLRTKHAQAHVLTVDTKAETVTLTTAGTTSTHQMANPDEFPKLHTIWPNELDWRHEPAAFHPERLARLMKSAEALTTRRTTDDARVTIDTLTQTKPSLWRMTHDGLEWHGLLMPMRIPS